MQKAGCARGGSAANDGLKFLYNRPKGTVDPRGDFCR